MEKEFFGRRRKMKKVFGELIVLKEKKNRDGKEGVSLEKGEMGAKP